MDMLSVFSPEFISGMLNVYVHMCVHTYIVIYINFIHAMHHKLLAASVLGTRMMCTKCNFSIICECVLAFSYK